MAADAVRIDIFVTPNEPNGCVLNELSLSSAMQYGVHSLYNALLWLEPHVRRSYTPLATTKPVYLLDGSEGPAPASGAQLMEAVLSTPSTGAKSWWWWCGPCPGALMVDYRLMIADYRWEISPTSLP